MCEHGNTDTLVTNLRPLLAKYGAHYMSGHDHCMEHLVEPGKKKATIRIHNFTLLVFSMYSLPRELLLERYGRHLLLPVQQQGQGARWYVSPCDHHNPCAMFLICVILLVRLQTR